MIATWKEGIILREIPRVSTINSISFNDIDLSSGNFVKAHNWFGLQKIRKRIELPKYVTIKVKLHTTEMQKVKTKKCSL